MDGFEQDEAGSESDKGCEVALCFLAAQGDAFEAFDFSDGLLDAGTALVERFGEEGRPVLFIDLVRDNGNSAALPRRLPIGLAGVTLVADCRARIDIRAEPEQDGEVRCIAFLASGQIEGDRMAVEICLQMDFGREAAARTAERLVLLPPFAPAAETWARTTVESNICTRCADELSAARWSKKVSKTQALLSRSNRFHTLFHLPKRSGSARQVML
nr:hypothetical protein [Mesorhizobium camelthorni]